MGVNRKTFRVIVEGGKATGGPPIGPALGPLGVNIPLIVSRINELTSDYAGLRVPVEINVNVEDKSFDILVCTPTTTALIAKEAKITKGSGTPRRESVGNISMEQVVKIAKLKSEQLSTRSLKSAVKVVLGSCISMGISINAKDPKEIQEELDQGIYDELLSVS